MSVFIRNVFKRAILFFTRKYFHKAEPLRSLLRKSKQVADTNFYLTQNIGQQN